MDLVVAVGLAEELLAAHGLHHWQVRLDTARRRAGVCHFDQQVLGLSAPLTRLHDEADVRDTILHEIAHALAGPRHGHDQQWRRIARQIGCSGERCLSTDAPAVATAWLGVCPAGHTVGRHRRPERVLTCRECSRRFDLEHLFTWTRHGLPADMHPNYTAELAGLRTGRRLTLLHNGSRVVLTAEAGDYAGLTGRILKRGRTRYHVRILDDGGVLQLPFAWVQRCR